MSCIAEADVTEVRLLTLADLEIFHALRVRACREEPTAFVDAHEELAAKPVQYFARYFDDGWIAGAFPGGELSAMAGIFRHKGLKVQHKGTLWGVYAVPQVRGRGLTRCCIETVMQQAKLNGLERIYLYTNLQNVASTGLYKSLGFEQWAVEQHDLKMPDGSYIDNAMMVKVLAC